MYCTIACVCIQLRRYIHFLLLFRFSILQVTKRSSWSSWTSRSIKGRQHNERDRQWIDIKRRLHAVSDRLKLWDISSDRWFQRVTVQHHYLAPQVTVFWTQVILFSVQISIRSFLSHPRNLALDCFQERSPLRRFCLQNHLHAIADSYCKRRLLTQINQKNRYPRLRW